MASVDFGLQAVEIECEFKSPVDEVKSARPTNLSIGHILNDVRLLGSWSLNKRTNREDSI